MSNKTMSIEDSWFVRDMIKATSDMWLKGWHERNGGNLSLRLLDQDVAPYRDHGQEPRSVRLGEPVPELAGQHFLVTGSGKYFRNVQLDPATNLGLIQVAPDGSSVAVLWGYKDGAVPTSELASHFKSHRVRQSVTDGRDRVIMHCHATNLTALTYVLELTTANVTRALWEMSTECVVVFPDGIGVMGWMVPGTDTIGDETARQTAHHTLVLWPFHGVFATGASLDEAFGLIDTAEKAAEILVKVIAMGGARQAIGTANLRDLARRFSVEPLTEAMEIGGWSLATKGEGA